MCGIAGFIDGSQTSSKEALMTVATKMVNTIRHRGPNHQGVWVDEKMGVALAHQRLSIIDCSPSGHQPMHSSHQRYVMVYNGEVYNFESLRAELIHQGVSFRGHSDTEVLLAAFMCWGIDRSLEKINGMFAIALLDKMEHTLYLIRDRLGQKPLYYAKQGDLFLFGSELKALQQHPKFKSTIDRDALAAYTRLNYVPAPLSIYQDTFKVLPGYYIKFDIDAKQLAHTICYWDHQKIAEQNQNNIFTGSYRNAQDYLENLLKDAVKIRMISDVPLGAFLSGGIDSSLVVSLMQSQSSKPMKTFTIGFNEKAFNEAQEARAIATHLGTDHTELYVSPDQAQSVIPNLPLIYDEPFADVSQIPTYLVSKLAREQVIVALSGDGGDEFFAGYNRHFWVPMLWQRFGRLPGCLKWPFLKLLTTLPPSFYNRLLKSKYKNAGDKVYKLASILKNNHQSEMYLDLISSWKSPNDIVLSANDVSKETYQQFFSKTSLDFIHQMMSLDARHYLPDDILVKVDRASMAMSLEVRAPLLDYRVVEFAWSLPLHCKTKKSSSKQILKSILSDYIPHSLIDRPKMGFGVPIGEWLRGPMKTWASDLLDADLLQQQGYFNVDLIREKWDEHQAGYRDWQYCLWNILMFQSFLGSTTRPQATEIVS